MTHATSHSQINTRSSHGPNSTTPSRVENSPPLNSERIDRMLAHVVKKESTCRQIIRIIMEDPRIAGKQDFLLTHLSMRISEMIGRQRAGEFMEECLAQYHKEEDASDDQEFSAEEIQDRVELLAKQMNDAGIPVEYDDLVLEAKRQLTDERTKRHAA